MADTLTSALLDPAIADMEQRWKASGIPDLYAGGNGPVSRERARNIRALLYPKPRLPQGAIEARVIPGPAGDIPVRIVRPVAGARSGTLVYFHGRGFEVGVLDSHEAHAIRLANRAGVVVLNVDYRLAPEHKFPAAPDDAEAAMDWAFAHLAQLGREGRPVAVAGDSAGGNLAAVCAVYCRNAGLPLAVQLLIYPGTGSGLGTQDMPEIRLALHGNAPPSVVPDPRGAPFHTPSLAGVAPTILGVGHHDFFYTDNLAYAARLREAGVPLLLREFADLNHGFFSYTAISPASEAAANLLCDDLREHLLALV
jgi:acetyl esterase